MLKKAQEAIKMAEDRAAKRSSTLESSIQESPKFDQKVISKHDSESENHTTTSNYLSSSLADTIKLTRNKTLEIQEITPISPVKGSESVAIRDVKSKGIISSDLTNFSDSAHFRFQNSQASDIQTKVNENASHDVFHTTSKRVYCLFLIPRMLLHLHSLNSTYISHLEIRKAQFLVMKLFVKTILKNHRHS